MRTPVVMSWSGGKDCAMALRELLSDDRYEVIALLTSIAEEFRRVSHHGVREELLEQQAQAIGLPLKKVYLPSGRDRPCTNEIYEKIMGDVMATFVAQGVRTVAFGDLFLQDLRAWREANLAKAGMNGLFPLWQRNTTSLAHDLIASGFRCYLSCVEGKVGPGFAGRMFDRDLLSDLPSGIDPCGENGEFHTFVHAGPLFQRPVDVQVGDIVSRDGRYYADLLPAGMSSVATAAAESIPPV